MTHHPSFPVTASPLWLLGIFMGCLLIFHLLFLKVWKLGKVGWKRVDYVWLGLAALGLVGGATEIRLLITENFVPMERSNLVATYNRLRDEVRFMTGGAVCRKFVRSEYSPPNFDAIQREYDEVCEFATQLYYSLPAKSPRDLQVIKLRQRPRITEPVLADIFADLDRLWDEYVQARRAFDETVAATERTDLELWLAVASPLLLAIALALRITKVTGEIRLET